VPIVMPASKIIPEFVKERSPGKSAPPAASRAQLAAAFAAVYIIWGSTYLAIRIGVTEIPPFFMASARYLVTGAILYPLARSRSSERPTRQHWASALLLGALLPATGNGFLTWAEQTVPSGIAALLVTTVTLWMVILEWVRPGGRAPTARTSAGLLLGFGGILLLVAPWQSTGRVNLIGAGVLMTGSLCWAAGSIASRHVQQSRIPLLRTAMQCLCGGTILFVFGSFTGEISRVHFGAITHRGWLALGYLTVFGSIIGYSAYTWLLHAAPPARVATYAYVNPVIAILLGWMFAGEHLTPRMLVATAVIIVGVVMVIAAPPRAAAPAEHLPEPEEAGL
jgi:drug/metabolite transporter (DMT)-like permease